MKKWFFLFLSLSSLLISCSKSDTNSCNYTESNATATAAEISFLQDYMVAHSILATQHPSGFFYTVADPGTGTVTATVCSTITLNYEGSFLSNGIIFDSNYQTAGISFVLGQLIVGWQKGLPLIKSGGTITIYIPPSLGYGSQDRYDNYGNIVIPANSYLKFSIHLLEVQ